MDYWRPVGSPCTQDRNRLDNKNFWFRCFSLSRYTDVDDRSLRDLLNVCLFRHFVSTLSISSGMFYANLSRYLCIRSFPLKRTFFQAANVFVVKFTDVRLSRTSTEETKHDQWRIATWNIWKHDFAIWEIRSSKQRVSSDAENRGSSKKTSIRVARESKRSKICVKRTKFFVQRQRYSSHRQIYTFIYW